jgi:hypothetical protein
MDGPDDGINLANYEKLLRDDFASVAARSFRELNPRTPFAANWHFDLVAAKLAAVRAGHIRRLIVSLPPRHLKSHLASIAFPAWCLSHDPSASILCVSYAQDLADKLSRDCRRTLASDWYQRLFPTRLSPRRPKSRSAPTSTASSRSFLLSCCPIYVQVGVEELDRTKLRPLLLPK